MSVRLCLDVDESTLCRLLPDALCTFGSGSASDLIQRHVVDNWAEVLEAQVQRGDLLRYTVGPQHDAPQRHTHDWTGDYEDPPDTMTPPAVDDLLKWAWMDLHLPDLRLTALKGATVQLQPPSYLRWGADCTGYPSNRPPAMAPPRWRHRRLKTVERYEMGGFYFSMPTRALKAVRDRFDSPCTCPSDALFPALTFNWPPWLLDFRCRICGKVYLCRCFQGALEEFVKEAREKAPRYARHGWPHRFLHLYGTVQYRDGICHVCRGVPSDVPYCGDRGNRNTFFGNYGFWIERTAVGKGIATRDAEDEIRELVGMPRTAEWVSEAMLLRFVQDAFRDQRVIHQARFEWLGRQSIDIYVPHLRLAIEYQGLQHYRPVPYFGGQDGFEQLQQRDRRKRELCAQHGVAVVYFRFDEELSRDSVRQRIMHHLGSRTEE